MNILITYPVEIVLGLILIFLVFALRRRFVKKANPNAGIIVIYVGAILMGVGALDFVLFSPHFELDPFQGLLFLMVVVMVTIRLALELIGIFSDYVKKSKNPFLK